MWCFGVGRAAVILFSQACQFLIGKALTMPRTTHSRRKSKKKAKLCDNTHFPFTSIVNLILIIYSVFCIDTPQSNFTGETWNAPSFINTISPYYVTILWGIRFPIRYEQWMTSWCWRWAMMMMIMVMLRIQCCISEEMKDSLKLYEYKLHLNLMKLASCWEYIVYVWHRNQLILSLIIFQATFK